MKDQFEKNIKSLVDDFSYDYDPKAWEALSKKLPSSPKGYAAFGKIAAIAIVITSMAALWYFTNTAENNATSVLKQKSIVKQQKTTKSQEKTGIAPSTSKNVAVSNAPILALATSQSQSNNQIEQAANVAAHATIPTNENLNYFESLQQRSALSIWPTPTNESLPPVSTHSITEAPQQQSAPCQGNKVVLSAETISYENGIPIIHINAETAASNLTWNSNGTLINQKAKGADLLAFRQQTYNVSAKVSQEGCNETETITITADQNYNLLAVNAFNPQSRDERNAKFMPFALTMRNVQFEMIVLDPDNGAVLFKTTDAQNAWDGIDQRSGQLIKAQKAYIWRVILENPLPGEKNTYSGTIVRI